MSKIAGQTELFNFGVANDQRVNSEFEPVKHRSKIDLGTHTTRQKCWIHTHIHTYIHTYTYSYTHTYIYNTF